MDFERGGRLNSILTRPGTPLENRLLAVVAPPVAIAAVGYVQAVDGAGEGLAATVWASLLYGVLALVCLVVLRLVVPRGAAGRGGEPVPAAVRWHRLYGDAATFAVSLLLSEHAAGLAAGGHEVGHRGAGAAALTVGVLGLVLASLAAGMMHVWPWWFLRLEALRRSRRGLTRH